MLRTPGPGRVVDGCARGDGGDIGIVLVRDVGAAEPFALLQHPRAKVVGGRKRIEFAQPRNMPIGIEIRSALVGLVLHVELLATYTGTCVVACEVLAVFVVTPAER